MPDLQPDLINGWNCSFTRDLTQLRTLPLNPATKMELLAGQADISVVSDVFYNFFAFQDFSSSFLVWTSAPWFSVLCWEKF